MARYRISVRSPWTQEQAFAYLSDLRNLERWDPGVAESRLVVGVAPGVGTAYDVTASSTELRYETIAFDAPSTTTARAENRYVVSLDEIGVEADGDGSIATYDAELTLKGPLRLFDPLLRRFLRRIGGDAAQGLERTLEGRRIE